MYSYDAQIKKFRDQKVTLPTDMRAMLLAHRKANADRIITRLPEFHDKARVGETNFKSQGSFAMDTVIQTRFTEEEYDIDYGLVIRKSQLANKDGSEMTSDEVKELIRDVLKDDRFSRQPRIMSNCVRVFYADDDDYKHHVDFPIYREFEDDDENSIREIAGETGWFKSNPTRVNEWLEDLVAAKNNEKEEAGTQMRRMVKLLKRFCRSRGDWDMPNGMKLTMLVSECFQFCEREDEAFYQLLKNIKSQLLWNLVIENLADENIPKAKLTKTTQDQNVVTLREKVNEAINELAILFKSDCKKEDARRAWDWVFQSDGFFKELEEKEKAEAKREELLAKASLINSGRAATTTAGRIVSVGGAGVANAAHSFYGEKF
jgi:hypothetical protein